MYLLQYVLSSHLQHTYEQTSFVVQVQKRMTHRHMGFCCFLQVLVAAAACALAICTKKAMYSVLQQDHKPKERGDV